MSFKIGSNIWCKIIALTFSLAHLTNEPKLIITKKIVSSILINRKFVGAVFEEGSKLSCA